MKILLLCTDSYGGHGGIALYNRDLAEALAARSDVEEVVIVPRVIRSEVGGLPPKVAFHADAAKGPAQYLRAVMRARSARPDLVICGHMNLLPVACSIARNPLLLAYGIEAWKHSRSALVNRLLHRVRAVVSISEITRDRLLAWSRYRGQTFLLPNAIHAENYGIREKRADLVARYKLEGKRVLLTVGRLAEEERYKGFDEVIEILRDLPEDVVYMIAGGGNDAVRLQQKAAHLGLGDRVVFTGLFSEEEKPDLYALADVYVMPSRGEGFGYVFLEALASGVPVIGSKHDGGREALLNGELGLLVDPANPAEIAAAIREVLDRPRERAIPPRLDYFSFENFKRRLSAIVDTI
ncbi:MAG TPA: glycosyltransferase family 4 protein [Thermoanaerobaculia bacterium]|jgi:glycosyltransferase involved in cell wall biosynthesis|nr:glycosyltransferase family 4 protein [Thermoanaerobaculia bacterium]